MAGPGRCRQAKVELSELRNSDQSQAVILLLPGGTLREHTAMGQVALLRPAAWGRWLVRGRYEWLRRRGTDPVFGVVNTLEDQHQVSGQVQVLPGAGRHALTLTLRLQVQEMQDLAARTQWRSQRGQGELRYLRRVGGVGRWSGFVQPVAGYAPQFSSSFQTANPSRFLEAIARPDYQALTAPAAYAGLGGAVEHWQPSGQAVRLSLSGRYYHTATHGYRLMAQTRLEWLF